MANIQAIGEAAETSRGLEQQLAREVSGEHVSFERVSGLLDRIRTTCSHALLRDIEAATARHVEDRLWDSHQKANSYFRSTLHKLKGSRSAVETRKTSSEYLRFLKASQRFYRGYISDLAQRHGGIPELSQVAKKLNREAGTPTASATPPVVAQLVLRSCHRSLIQLGDLSRYRETELGGPRKDWSHAIDLYDLANVILPASGIGHNQLAVVALADNNLLDAIYHLYRALATPEPHTQAEGNLKKALFKTSQAWDRAELSNRGTIEANSTSPDLVPKFLRFISKCYHGKLIQKHKEFEDDVVALFRKFLFADFASNTLHRIVLLVISAGFSAQQRFQNPTTRTDEASQSFLYFFRLNIRFFHAILHVFEAGAKHGDIVTTNDSSAKQLPTSVQPLLPPLRIYSNWLAVNLTLMTHTIERSVDQLQAQFWARYASCLTFLYNRFSLQSLPKVHFMLYEDIDTLDCPALLCPETRACWFNGQQRRTFNLEQAGNHKNDRKVNLVRVKGILETALTLKDKESCPLKLNPAQRIFESTEPHETLSPLASPARPFSSSNALGLSHASCDSGAKAPSEVLVAEKTQDEEAEKMVSSLVEVGDEDDFAISNTAMDLADSTEKLVSERPVSSSSAGSPSVSSGAAARPGLSRNGSFPSPNIAPAILNRSPHLSSSALLGRPNSGSRDTNSRPAQFGSPHGSPNIGLEAPSRTALARHTRVHSNDSTHSQHSIWSPSVGGDGAWDAVGADKPARTHQANPATGTFLGNGTFGTMDAADPDKASEIPPALPLASSPNPWKSNSIENRQLMTGSPRPAQVGKAGGTSLWKTTPASGQST